MDYGKISYYKAEELEQRLVGGRFNVATVRKTGILSGQTAAVATLKGRGLLIVRVEAANGIRTTVYLNGAEAGNGEGSYTMAVAAEAGAVSVLPQFGGSVTVTVTYAGWGGGAEDTNKEQL